jgi:Carboxypeptidase regulatory-like domain
MNGSSLAGAAATIALLLAPIVLTFATPSSLQAQQSKKEKREAATERTVEGTVSDPDGKFIDGAVVQLKDMRTLQVRSFYTIKNGGYHFSGLKVDIDYELRAEYKDLSCAWKRLSIFDTRKIPVMNLKLEKTKPETKAETKAESKPESKQ